MGNPVPQIFRIPSNPPIYANTRWNKCQRNVRRPSDLVLSSTRHEDGRRHKLYTELQIMNVTATWPYPSDKHIGIGHHHHHNSLRAKAWSDMRVARGIRPKIHQNKRKFTKIRLFHKMIQYSSGLNNSIAYRLPLLNWKISGYRPGHKSYSNVLPMQFQLCKHTTKKLHFTNHLNTRCGFSMYRLYL